jgi:molybdenum-dependent DNA-binding transcriptional regulator ModE
MRRKGTITDNKVKEVKSLISKTGLRQAARLTGISYYTVWAISKGKYDSDEPLQQTNKWQNRCFITGFKLN